MSDDDEYERYLRQVRAEAMPLFIVAMIAAPFFILSHALRWTRGLFLPK